MAIQLTPRESNQIYDLIESISDVKFSDRKQERVEALVRSRLYALKLRTLLDYLILLREYPDLEVPFAINLLTVHHTHFFREKQHFDYLKQEILAPFLKNEGKSGSALKIWCPACSTGQEAYSLAMVVDSFFRENNFPGTYEIHASDIDEKSIVKAKNGVYPFRVINSIPKIYQSLYCRPERGENPQFFKIKDFLLDRIKWGVQDIKRTDFMSFGSTLFDAVFVRNVFIYFSSKEIQRVVQGIQKYLKKEGALFLGQSENLHNLETGFVHQSLSIYKYQESVTPRQETHVEAPSPLKPMEILPSTSKIRALVVDDSTTIHLLIKKILSSAEDIEIVNTSMHGKEALDFLEKHSSKVDVIISDINMPYMDGIELLKKQMARFQIPTMIVSAISEADAKKTFKTFELGAAEYMEKPRAGNLLEESATFIEKVRNCAKTKFQSKKGEILKPLQFNENPENKLILIGSSTGGPKALETILRQFPKTTPPIVIAQHMPPSFTRAMAEHLDQHCLIKVVEAENSMILKPGHAYVAPGGHHMKLVFKSGELQTRITQTSETDNYSPSVDILFNSAAREAADNYVIAAMILTGMGSDGTEGATFLKTADAKVFGQNEESSVVFGMAKNAHEKGLLAGLFPIEELSKAALDSLRKGTDSKTA